MGSGSHLIQGLLGRAGNEEQSGRTGRTGRQAVQTDRQYKQYRQCRQAEQAVQTDRQCRQAEQANRQCRQYRQTDRQAGSGVEQQAALSQGACATQRRHSCFRCHPWFCLRKKFLLWADCPAPLKALCSSSAGSPGQQEQVGHGCCLYLCPHCCPPQLGLAGAQQTGAVRAFSCPNQRVSLVLRVTGGMHFVSGGV